MTPLSMAGYTKLFNSILASTIWRADDKTRIVWITLLAMADRWGVAEGSVPGLADLAHVSIEDAEMALFELSTPDKYSRTKEFEGRRIEAVDGGWRIINHGKYRAKMGADERREYNRQKQAEWRERKKVSTKVNHGQSQSALSRHTEAKADTEALKKGSGYSVPACFESVEGFSAALAGWIESRKTQKKPATGRAVQLLIDRLAEKPDRAVEALNAAIERGWMTVKWDWLDNHNGHSKPSKPNALIAGTCNEGISHQYAGIGRVKVGGDSTGTGT